MNVDFILGGVTLVGLITYLIFVIAFPDKF
jgi:hypothetical protein